jgi:hypothetical protein
LHDAAPAVVEEGVGASVRAGRGYAFVAVGVDVLDLAALAVLQGDFRVFPVDVVQIVGQLVVDARRFVGEGGDEDGVVLVKLVREIAS